MRELAFRCAHSGGRFAVLYAKESRDSKFRVRAIEEEAHVIKRLLGSATAARTARAHTTSRIAAGEWAAFEFDHSGWRCPHCSSRGVSTDSFIKCGTCNGLVCGASLIQVRCSHVSLRMWSTLGSERWRDRVFRRADDRYSLSSARGRRASVASAAGDEYAQTRPRCGRARCQVSAELAPARFF